MSIRQRIESSADLAIELGCGARKQHPDAIGIDALDYEGVDIVGDIHAVLRLLPDGRIQRAYAYHCFEHLDDLGAVLDELGRVLTPGGSLVVVVPHFSNPYFYSDWTHRQPFGLYTFSYLAEEALFARRCPDYQRNHHFKLQRVALFFKSPRPFYGRWAAKRLIQWLVNLNRYTLEFYEENLCWLMPCYEIRYELSRRSTRGSVTRPSGAI